MLNWPLCAQSYDYIWNTKVWICSFSCAYKKYLFNNVEIRVARWWKGAISSPTVKIQEDLTNDLISSASPGHRLLLLFYWLYFINPFILEPRAELQSHCCQSIRMKVNIFSPMPVRPPPFVWMDGWKGGACFGMSKIHHYRWICCSAPKSVDTNLCGEKKSDLLWQKDLSTRLPHLYVFRLCVLLIIWWKCLCFSSMAVNEERMNTTEGSDAEFAWSEGLRYSYLRMWGKHAVHTEIQAK